MSKLKFLNVCAFLVNFTKLNPFMNIMYIYIYLMHEFSVYPYFSYSILTINGLHPNKCIVLAEAPPVEWMTLYNLPFNVKHVTICTMITYTDACPTLFLCADVPPKPQPER